MTLIDSKSALGDLSEILMQGETRRIREGAACGLARTRTPAAVNVLVEAVRMGRLLDNVGGSMLEDQTSNRMLVQYLGDSSEKIARMGIHILGVRALREERIAPTEYLVEAARKTLKRVKTSPRIRRSLEVYLQTAK